jgi:hypothetical protein
MSTVCQLPTAIEQPVSNPRWRGRYPRGVACFANYKRAQELQRLEALGLHDRGASNCPTNAAAELPQFLMVRVQGQTHPVGTVLLDINGNEVRVVEGFGVFHITTGYVVGYVCERLADGCQHIHRAGGLFTPEGVSTHLAIVKGA